MLELIRKNRSSILGTFVLCIVAVFMLSFGLESYIQPQNSSSAIRIDDHEISSNTYYGRIRRMEQLYRRQLGENYDKMKGYLKLEQNTIDSLIDEYLLQGFISQIGLHAGVKLIEHQIREEVLSIPQLGGEFNQQSYNTYLRARGVTGAQLEVETGQQLRVNQLSNFFRDTAIVTEPELKAVHTEQNTTYQFNYLKLESAKFEDNVDLSKEEEIAKHFEDNIESYRKPRSVKFEYVEFRPADFEEGVVIQDEDLNLLYKQQRHEFREPTTYHVRQIVAYKNRDKEKSKLEEFVTGADKSGEASQSTDASGELKKAKLEEALKRLDDGELFEDVAKEVTEDEAGIETGGDLGWLAFADVATHLKAPLKDLEQDQFSEVIETNDAYYIIYLQERKEGREKELEEVRETLERTIRQNESGVYARAAAYDFYDALRANPDKPLEEAAKQANLVYLKLEEAAHKGENPEGLQPGIIEKTINLPLDRKELIEFDDITYVVNITETKDSYLPELKDVRDEVLKAYTAEAAVTLAKAAAEEMKVSLEQKDQGKKSQVEEEPAIATEEVEAAPKELTRLAMAAQNAGVEIKETSVVSRNSAFSEPFDVVDLKNAAFSLTPESPLSADFFEKDGAFYFVELKEVKLPEGTSFEDSKKDLEQTEKSRAENRMQAALVAHLRANSDIWVDPQLTVEQR